MVGLVSPVSVYSTGYPARQHRVSGGAGQPGVSILYNLRQMPGGIGSVVELVSLVSAYLQATLADGIGLVVGLVSLVSVYSTTYNARRYRVSGRTGQPGVSIPYRLPWQTVLVVGLVSLVSIYFTTYSARRYRVSGRTGQPGVYILYNLQCQKV